MVVGRAAAAAAAPCRVGLGGGAGQGVPWGVGVGWDRASAIAWLSPTGRVGPEGVGRARHGVRWGMTLGWGGASRWGCCYCGRRHKLKGLGAEPQGGAGHGLGAGRLLSIVSLAECGLGWREPRGGLEQDLRGWEGLTLVWGRGKAPETDFWV